MTFQIWDTKKVLTRIDYGILDLLADIGGLYKVLQIGIYLLLMKLVEDGPSLFIMTSLLARSEDEQLEKRSFTERSSRIAKETEAYDSRDVKTHCCLFLRLKMAGSRCYKGSKKDRFIAESHKNLQSEFEISNLFKKMNILEGALKDHFNDPKKWRAIVEKHSLFTIREQLT